MGVDIHDQPGDIFIFIHLHTGQHAAQGGHKIAPDQGLVRDGGDGAGGDDLCLHQLQLGAEIGLAFVAHCLIGEKQVQCEEILIFRIDAVSRKTAAQTVRALVHGFHALDDLLSAHPFAASGDHRRDGAAGGVAEFAFFLAHGLHLPSKQKSKGLRLGIKTQAERLCSVHTILQRLGLVNAGAMKF